MTEDNLQYYDSLQERNQQVLNNISQLQIQEKDLYTSLDNVTLSTEQKQQIINKINEISQIRMNLYATLTDTYSLYQKNVSASRNTLGQSMEAIDILENELNQSKIKMNLLEEQKYNKLRLVEINTYYGKRYNAHSKLMKTIVIICIPIIILTILVNKGILFTKLYAFLLALILVFGIWSIGTQLIDIGSRDNMNWDEYYWYFDKSKAPSDTIEPSTNSSTNSSNDPWNSDSISLTCIGSACCYDGSTYDSTQNMCVPNVYYSNVSQTKITPTDPLKELEKYGHIQDKAVSVNNNVSPVFSSLSKF
jgi:hypothetical protein